MNWEEFEDKNKDWIHVKNAEGRTVEFINNYYNETMFTISENGFALESLFLSKPHEQLNAVRFLAQKPKEWFKGIEKKYNIILARDTNEDHYYTAYLKEGESYNTSDTVTLHDLLDGKYRFTQSQIDDLKSYLPDSMKRIVDIAKTEVTDNGD